MAALEIAAVHGISNMAPPAHQACLLGGCMRRADRQRVHVSHGQRMQGPAHQLAAVHDELGDHVHVVVARGAQGLGGRLPGPKPLVQLDGT